MRKKKSRNPWDIERNPHRRKRRPSRNFDFDGDGVPNWKDCKPYNPFLQHVGPSEMPVNTKEDLMKTAKRVLANAFAVYGGKTKALDVANVVIKARLDKKYYSPKGNWDIKARGYPVFKYSTMFEIGPVGNLIEVRDDFHDVYFYADVTDYFNMYSAIEVDGKYMKGISGGKPMIVLIITAQDKAKLGKDGMGKLMEFISDKGGVRKIRTPSAKRRR